jgi:hypothetical protein
LSNPTDTLSTSFLFIFFPFALALVELAFLSLQFSLQTRLFSGDIHRLTKDFSVVATPIVDLHSISPFIPSLSGKINPNTGKVRLFLLYPTSPAALPMLSSIPSTLIISTLCLGV